MNRVQSRPACQGWTGGISREFGGVNEMTTPSWPLRSHLELGAFATAVPCARLHARLMALEWRPPTLAETTERLVSELVR